MAGFLYMCYFLLFGDLMFTVSPAAHRCWAPVVTLSFTSPSKDLDRGHKSSRLRDGVPCAAQAWALPASVRILDSSAVSYPGTCGKQKQRGKNFNPS